MFKWLKNKLADTKLSLIERWIVKTEDKHRILSLAVRRLFCATTEDDVLKELDGKLFYMGKALTETEVRLLKTETTGFLSTKLWQILQKEIEWQANKRMFVISKTEQDLIAGKIALFNLDVIKSVLKRLTQAK